jgi:hypothetical protein
VDEAKNANSTHHAFSLFISDDILNIILTNTNKKIHDYLLNFTGKVSIRTAIVMCGLVSDSEENTMQDPEDYDAISRKQECCHVCSRSRDVKTPSVAF